MGETTDHRGIVLASNLWLDQPDNLARIEDKQRRGELSDAEAENLHFFAENGYVILTLDLNAAALDAVVSGVDRLWKEKPADLAYACDSPARPFSAANEARERRTRYRLHDVHSHLEPALALYLDQQIFTYVKLILGDNAVAIQSLFFEYGSEQILHRDPVVVPTGAPGHLLASWIALEDISPDCGALVYIPGSHRLPYYTFAPGQYMFDESTMGEAEIAAATAFDDAQCAAHGLEPKLLTAKKGQVLIWHASLRHGGSPVRDASLTRKSLVVHYSTRDTYQARSITVQDRVESADGTVADQPRIMETRTLLHRNGSQGYDNPMRGYVRTSA